MKKTDSIPSNSEIRENIYEVVYADSRDEEARMNFLNRRQISAHMARWVLDYEHNQLLWSDGIYEILELNPINFGASETHFLNLIHPDDQQIKINTLNQLHKETKPIEITYRLQFSDGHIKWINEICNTEFDKFGHPVRTLGIVQDITKYKLTEESFYQKEEWYRSLINSLPEGIIISRNNKCVFANNAAKKLLEGRSRQQMISKNIFSYIHPGAKANFKKKMQGLNLSMPTAQFEQKMVRMDGSAFIAEVTLTLTISQDMPAFQIIINAIPERVRAVRQLKESD
jgi:PAS domain S-box-containing protein